MSSLCYFSRILVQSCILLCALGELFAQDIIGCGGFVKSEVEINYSLIEVKLYTKQGSLKYQTDCAPNSGYYMIPVYDKGDYVLKVEPPAGWTFEPESIDLKIDGVNDLCSKSQDVNFRFTGFGVVGQVVNSRLPEGPAGVTLTLKKAATKEVVKQTTSVTGGGYTFEKVLPGEYVVEASHRVWLFEKESSIVNVGRETGKVVDNIILRGYDVRGKVLSEGEPVAGVMFLLYNFPDPRWDFDDMYGCNNDQEYFLVRKAIGVERHPYCFVTSKEDGTFVFPALPNSDVYWIVPYFKGETIQFDVAPTRLDFKVNHASIEFKEPFQVTGFSVVGSVFTHKGGKPVEGAQVLLDGKPNTVTSKLGEYRLESMKAGSYKIEIIADGYIFDPITAKLSVNTPQLGTFFASKFSICGQVIIEKMPEGLSHMSKHRKISVKQKANPEDVLIVNTKEDGRFCAPVKPGAYLLEVALSDVEIRAGLKMAPAEREVKVEGSPVKDIKFSQFRAQVGGQIKCLEKCGPIQVTLAPIGRQDDRQTIQSQTYTDGTHFTFYNVMPGKYKVILSKDEWCWKENSLEVTVADCNINDLTFIQTGYILSCSLSHDITLNFAQENKEGNVGSFNLTKGVNKFCLSQPGVYKLKPVSCHKFEHSTFTYDTSSPHVLSLMAVSHRIKGFITSDTMQDDIMVTISSSLEGVEPTIVGPLTIADKPEKKSPGKEGQKDSKDKPTEDHQGPFTYKFTHWAKEAEKLTISASSKVLLFYPSSTAVTVRGDTCPGTVAKFEGRKGVFIHGQVMPALVGVQITILCKTEPDVKIEMTTDEQGKYTVGPLHGDKEYSISAVKPGYVMTASEQQGHFNAFKLGEIKVKVEDEYKVPLGGVLLSLSGGHAYRSNNLSKADGSMDFIGLSPGQYYLRPMMKEYSFTPTSQMIEVTEGATINLVITGNRVAFSCYGSVTSLNGEPEQEVFVEAVGRGSEDCQVLQEESKTEPDGAFRIRGLQPRCDYEIRLRSGDVNLHIERAAPKSRIVQVVDSDLRDIHIIAFRRISQMEISGNIVTSQEYFSSLKVNLYKENNLDSSLHSTSLGPTSFFYLPSLKIDNEEYVLRLESSLSKTSYDHASQEITFTANSTYKHFTFTFNPKRKPMDQELSQGSLLALPITILVIFLAYNYKQVVPVLLENLASLKNFTATRRQSSGGGGDATDNQPTNPIEIQLVQKKQKLRKA